MDGLHADKWVGGVIFFMGDEPNLSIFQDLIFFFVFFFQDWLREEYVFNCE